MPGDFVLSRDTESGELSFRAVLATTLGCATRSAVTIEGVEPALMELGTTRHLVLLEGDGRRSAQQIVFRQLARQARATGYFTVQDRTREGHTVSVVGTRADHLSVHETV